MTALKNPKHEIFAQELAVGGSAIEAYSKAGYKRNSGNCIRLKGNERIAQRVLELQRAGAARSEVTIASLVQELDQARSEALRLGQASAAVAATMGKAKITGQIIDRAEIKNTSEFDAMSEKELRDFIAHGIKSLGFGIGSDSKK